MTKVAIKSKNIKSFGGFFSCNEHFLHIELEKTINPILSKRESSDNIV